MSKQIRFMPAVIGLLSLFIWSCSGVEEASNVYIPEKYRGTYQAGNESILGDVKVDSVEFTVVAPERYVTFHYDAFTVDFCDSEGGVLGVGTPVFRFHSVKYTSTNCDSVNGVNVGIFTAVYRQDSLWLVHAADPGDPNIYEFALIRVK